jgi:hypothetical protein
MRRVGLMSEQQRTGIYPVLHDPDPAAGIAFLEDAFLGS